MTSSVTSSPKRKPKKPRSWTFFRGKQNEIHYGKESQSSVRSSEDEEDNETRSGHDHSKSHKSDTDSKVESNSPQTPKVVETYPDSENELHEVIRNQNWDLLDILLKEYDYKKYIKPKEQKKPPRKLRIAKYLPDVHWKKEVEVPPNPLYGLDALGRAPLHLCCASPCPEKSLMRLLFCARELSSVTDVTGSLPLHLAIIHDHGKEVIDKLIRGYHHGAIERDSSGRTPLMWAIEMIRRHKEEQKDEVPSNHTYWAHPLNKEGVKWQTKQRRLWEIVEFMLENRKIRRQKMLPAEYRRIIIILGLAGTPNSVSIFLQLAENALKIESTASQTLSLCISRQYPLEILEKIVEACPQDFAKDHKDSTGRGVVSAHYRIGCVAHLEDLSDGNSKRESFRMIMQNLANVAMGLQEKFSPSKSYRIWWNKLKFLINLWGTSIWGDEDASHDDFDMDDLLLHNALSNADVPPSLIRLLASLRPNAIDLEHPKSTALPIHLACRVWRYKPFPSRKGEKETHLDKVAVQLLEGDTTRTRKRYRDRLPIHHAAASGHGWMFVKPLVVHDRKSLQIRDPMSKVYPFQLAASIKVKVDVETLARRKFTNMEWNSLNDSRKEHFMHLVQQHYELEHLSLIFELLRHHPQAISHQGILQAEAVRSASKPKRMIVVEGIHASDDVAMVANTKMIRGLFDLGPISSHFIAWAYELTRRGWKTHRSHFAVIKEGIMDGFIPSAMDKWWRKLKFWIWQDCPWESKKIPHRDDFLLHGALCNPDVSPWIISLILECFPRSVSIPLPGTKCYPLHIACTTDKYVPLAFEFPNKSTVIGMIMKAYPDAALLKWQGRLPLHLAISHSKDWSEIKYLAKEEPIALEILDPEDGFFPFQMMAVGRSFTEVQKKRFELSAQKQIGRVEWKAFSSEEKVEEMSKILEEYEKNVLGGIWEMLVYNSSLLTVDIVNNEDSAQSILRNKSKIHKPAVFVKSESMSTSATKSKQQLSMASMDFLENMFEEETKRAAARKHRESSRSSMSLDGSISDPFLGSSFRIPSTEQTVQPLVRQHENRRNGASSRSSVTLEDSIIDPFVGNSFRMPPRMMNSLIIEEKAIQNYDVSVSELEEISVQLNLKGGYNQDEMSSTNIQNTIKSMSSLEDSQASSELGPLDHSELCTVRKKDIMLITNGSAHVIWRYETIPVGAIPKEGHVQYWQKILQYMGEPVDIKEVHLVRHEHEQITKGFRLTHGTAILIDEDESYNWIICGENSCSLAENFDVEAAIVISSSLLDSDTRYWLEPFQKSKEKIVDDSTNDFHSTLDWILKTAEKRTSVAQNTPQELLITRRMLRNAFANASRNAIDGNATQIVKDATRKLWFFVAKEKMSRKIAKRNFIGVKFFISNKSCFDRQRNEFNKQQKRIKFMKGLRKKQRQALKDGLVEKLCKADDSETNVSRLVPLYLRNLHQPNNMTEEDCSLEEPQIFDPPSLAPIEKPLLVAAQKAKAQRDQAQQQGSEKAFTILETMHQPERSYGDENISLDSIDLFDDENPIIEKPMLAAALKAKKENEGRSGIHLLNLHQPLYPTDDDTKSIAPQDIFDAPKGPAPRKPMLAAALKAKKQTEESRHAARQRRAYVAKLRNASGKSQRQTYQVPLHLRQIHQPKTINEDDNLSLAAKDVFEPMRDSISTKPLLAAALKAKGKHDQRLREQGQNPNLISAHQPSVVLDDDESSLVPGDIFEPLSPISRKKPLLEAAKKAKAGKEQFAMHGGVVPYHLRGVHQPATIYEDDEVSLGAQTLFEPTQEVSLSNPLLTAARKAKAQQNRRLMEIGDNPKLMNAHQPKYKVMEDDDISIAASEVFDDHPPPSPKKPLLAAARKAKLQRQYFEPAGSNTTPLHLEKLNQPIHRLNTEGGDDDVSLPPASIFDPHEPPPAAKPLLAAARKAKEQRDAGILESPKRPQRSILRASTILKGPPLNDEDMDFLDGENVDIDQGNPKDESMTMGELFLSSPSRKRERRRKKKQADSLLSAPKEAEGSHIMKAALIRTNSIDEGRIRRRSVEDSTAAKKTSLITEANTGRDTEEDTREIIPDSVDNNKAKERKRQRRSRRKKLHDRSSRLIKVLKQNEG